MDITCSCASPARLQHLRRKADMTGLTCTAYCVPDSHFLVAATLSSLIEHANSRTDSYYVSNFLSPAVKSPLAAQKARRTSGIHLRYAIVS